MTGEFRRWLNAPSREVEMERSHDVDVVMIDEHPKARTDTRVAIKELVLAIPSIEYIIDVHDA